MSNYDASKEVLLKEAIQIASIVKLRDYQRFFKKFMKTNYMFAC